MKHCILIFVTLLMNCLNQSNRTEEKSSDEFVISNGKFGIVSIGDNIDATVQKLKNNYVIQTDSLPTCEGCQDYTRIFYVLDRKTSNKLFSIEPGWEENNKSKVFRLISQNRELKTDLGFHVGMTINDLKSKYEFSEIDISGETGIHILVKGFNGSFGIEIPDAKNWWDFKLETLPDTLKIVEIIVI